MAKRASGRRAWTADEARAVLDLWDESGQSGATFARSLGVIPQRLFWWRRRIGARGVATAVAPKKSRLVPMTVRGAAPLTGSAPVVVTTPTGVRIEVNEVDSATAAWVMALLGGEARS
jgi:transposase-like protein